MCLVLQPPLQTKQAVVDASQFHHWQEAPHHRTVSQGKQANIKELFALEIIILKMPKILLTRKSSSQYTLPLTL